MLNSHNWSEILNKCTLIARQIVLLKDPEGEVEPRASVRSGHDVLIGWAPRNRLWGEDPGVSDLPKAHYPDRQKGGRQPRASFPAKSARAFSGLWMLIFSNTSLFKIQCHEACLRVASVPLAAPEVPWPGPRPWAMKWQKLSCKDWITFPLSSQKGNKSYFRIWSLKFWKSSSMVGRIMPLPPATPPKMSVHVLISEISECFILHSKRDLADKIELRI